MQGEKGEKEIGKRFHNVDVLECLAIFFIVFYHSWDKNIFNFSGNPSLSTYIIYIIRSILSTGVPLFFFCNGYLLFQKDFSMKKHLKRAFKFFTLCLIWSIVTVLIVYSIRIPKEPLTLPDFIDIVRFGRIGWNNHLWFLRTLVVIYILFPIMKVIYDHNTVVFNYMFAIAMAFVIGNIILQDTITLAKGTPAGGNLLSFFSDFRYPHDLAYPYFLLGGVVAAHKQRLSQFISSISHYKTKCVIMLILSCAALGIYGVAYVRITGIFFDNVFDSYGSIFTFINVAMLYVLTINSRFSGSWFDKFVVLVSINTLGIYFLHVFPLRFINNPGIYQILDSYRVFDNPFLGLILSIFVLLISLLGAVALKRIPIVKKLL